LPRRRWQGIINVALWKPD